MLGHHTGFDPSIKQGANPRTVTDLPQHLHRKWRTLPSSSRKGLHQRRQRLHCDRLPQRPRHNPARTNHSLSRRSLRVRRTNQELRGQPACEDRFAAPPHEIENAPTP